MCGSCLTWSLRVFTIRYRPSLHASLGYVCSLRWSLWVRWSLRIWLRSNQTPSGLLYWIVVGGPLWPLLPDLVCRREGGRSFVFCPCKCLILLRFLGPGVGSKVAFPVSHWNHWIFYSEPQVRVRPTLWVSKCLWCPVPSVCSGLYYYTILRGSKSQPLITKKRWKKSEFFGWLIG